MSNAMTLTELFLREKFEPDDPKVGVHMALSESSGLENAPPRVGVDEGAISNPDLECAVPAGGTDMVGCGFDRKWGHVVVFRLENPLRPGIGLVSVLDAMGWTIGGMSQGL